MTILNRIIFFLYFFSIIFGIQFLVFRTFRKFVKSKFKYSKFLEIISIYPFIIFNLPFVYIIVNRFSSGQIPEWVYNSLFIPFYVFQGAVIFIGLYLLIGKIIKAPFSITLLDSQQVQKNKICFK